MLDKVEQQGPVGASALPAVWRRRLLKAAGFAAGWAVLAVLVGYHLFMSDSRQTVIAGHDATVSPTRDGYATVDLGAFIPDLRYPTGHDLGVDIVVGKTSLDSYQSLLQRYELIGSHPQGEIDKVTRLVSGMLVSDAVKGAVIGLAGPLAWLVVGHRRRHELRLGMTRRRVAVGATAAVVAVTLTTSTPFSDPSGDAVVAKDSWESIATFLPETPIPAQARPLQIEAGLMTSGTQSLIESAFRGYNTSVVFYHDLAREAARLGPQLRRPRPADTVVLFVADRHDNVGMDPVARAIGDAGGATVLFDAGDDTSTGEPWETFSLDSLVDSFSDLHGLYQVPGNHDNGTFVASYLGGHGFTVLSGEPLRTSDGIELLGVADPRSSGLGNWRTTSGITFDAQARKLADVACRSDENGHRVSTLLVHDASMGYEALRRGCVDLVLGGHLHTQVGPDRVTGVNGDVGVSFTNGTTGGAAYAVAVGTKLRRDAEVTLVTYRAGKPVGLQPVSIDTTGRITVHPYYRMRAALHE
jgi:hypothetical protein